MSTPVVQQQFTLPSGVRGKDVLGTVRLATSVVDEGEEPSDVAYFSTSGGTSVLGSIVVVLDKDGYLKKQSGASLTLNPNSGGSADAITSPVGSVYYLDLLWPGQTVKRYWFAVTDVAGPLTLFNILASTPVPLDGHILDGGSLGTSYSLTQPSIIDSGAI